MSINLYIVRHGKINIDEKNRAEYLHLTKEGLAFGTFLDNHFKNVYFDHIFYQSTDVKNSDPYNRCRNTIRGLKGIKTEFDKTQISMVFEEINKGNNDVQNVMLCFRAEGFNAICNIIGSESGEQFNKDYHRVFYYKFNSNNYSFVNKFSAEEAI